MARVQSDFDAMALWSSEPKTLRADRDLDRILVSATRLPVRYWRPRMFFSGAPDKILWDLTQKGFPKKLSQKALICREFYNVHLKLPDMSMIVGVFLLDLRFVVT